MKLSTVCRESRLKKTSSTAISAALALVVFVGGLQGIAKIRALGQREYPLQKQWLIGHENGNFFVVDAESKMIYEIDLRRALIEGSADGAVLNKILLVDEVGEPVKAKPLGLAIGFGSLYVSFDDKTLLKYRPWVYDEDGTLHWSYPPERFVLPRVAKRMDIPWATDYEDSRFLAYISDWSGTEPYNTIFMADPWTLEDVGQFQLSPPLAPDSASTDPGEGKRGDYPLTGISVFPLPLDPGFEIWRANRPLTPDWADFKISQAYFAIGASSASPQAFSVVNLKGDPDMDDSLWMQEPVPLTQIETPLIHGADPLVRSDDFALTTLYPVREEFLVDPYDAQFFHFFRDGNEVRVYRSERIYKMAYFPSSIYSYYQEPPHDDPEASTILWWGESLSPDPERFTVDPKYQGFNLLAFRTGFMEDTTIFYPNVNIFTAPGEPAYGTSPTLPFDDYTIDEVDPFSISIRDALNLKTHGRTPRTFKPRIQLQGGETPPILANDMGFKPQGYHKLVVRDNPKSTDYPEGAVVNMMEIYKEVESEGIHNPRDEDILTWIRQSYLGTDDLTGARYVGNQLLEPSPGHSRFTLPSELKDPQDIAVRKDEQITSTLSGSVFVLDANNRKLPIRDVPVRVEVRKGLHHYDLIAYTDDNGMYSVNTGWLVPDYEYRVNVTLKEREGMIAVRSEKGFNRQVVFLNTSWLRPTNLHNRFDIQFSNTTPGLNVAITPDQRKVLRDAGVVYHYTHRAYLFARDNLGLKPDFKLPVDIYIHSSVEGVFYDTDDSSINIQEDEGDSRYDDGESPDNREYHEFGHHVHTDSGISGDNNIPPITGTDKNHGGVSNSDSSDSVTEGFAEFFSMMVDGNSQYKMDTNAFLPLQNNMLRFANGTPIEELNVASLLWDLYDDDNEPGDHFSLDAKTIWNLLNNDDISTVHSIWQVLEPIYRDQDTFRDDGMKDLEQIFVLHGFFSDTSADGVWNRTEKVGYADYWNPRSATGKPPRQKQPSLRGNSLGFRVTDGFGHPLIAGFEVHVSFDDDFYDYTYETKPGVSSGQLNLYVPHDSRTAEIVPIKPGYEGESLILNTDDFWGKVLAAQERGEEVFMNHTFLLTESGAPMPLNFKGSLIGGVNVSLSWRIPEGVDKVLLVRAIDNLPISPSDGELIYEGTGTDYLDTETFMGFEHFYSLFGIGDRGVSEGASISFMVKPIGERVMLLFALVMAVIVAFGRRFLGSRGLNRRFPESRDPQYGPESS